MAMVRVVCMYVYHAWFFLKSSVWYSTMPIVVQVYHPDLCIKEQSFQSLTIEDIWGGKDRAQIKKRGLVLKSFINKFILLLTVILMGLCFIS